MHMQVYKTLYNTFTQTHMSMITLTEINHVFNHVIIILFHCIYLKASMLYSIHIANNIITEITRYIATFDTLPYVFLMLDVLSMQSYVKLRM